MTDKTLWEYQRAAHRRAEEVLTRAVNNEELMAQVQASLEAIARGERGTPFRQILAEERRRRSEA